MNSIILTPEFSSGLKPIAVSDSDYESSFYLYRHWKWEI